MITCEWSDWRNGTFWWIQSVYVRREYRGRGVYTGLHRQVEKMARERGDIRGLRLYVEKNNETAQRSYRRLGMSETNYQMYAIDFVLGRGKPASRET
jgi:ribosomal protein S18 acetylase RimI-like enzyme